MSFLPFRPQTPISSAGAAELPSDYLSPQVQIPRHYFTRREKSSSPEPEFSESEGDGEQPNVVILTEDVEQYLMAAATTLHDDTSSWDGRPDDHLPRTADAFNHIYQHVLSVAGEFHAKYKSLLLVHFQAVDLDYLYSNMINWRNAYSESLSISMRRRVAYFASPDNFLASLISSFLLAHVFTAEALHRLNLSGLEFNWDSWIENEPLIERTGSLLSEQLASKLVEHIFWNGDDADDHLSDHDFIAGVSAGLVREALVFALCTSRREEDFEFPHAGTRFEPLTMKPLEGTVERVRDRAVLLTVFPGINLPSEDAQDPEAETLLEPVIVLEEEATHY